jgi:hypothetical protein
MDRACGEAKIAQLLQADHGVLDDRKRRQGLIHPSLVEKRDTPGRFSTSLTHDPNAPADRVTHG